jgi:serine phosphatase RsbU (regulator of sigma subunit)
MAIGGTTDDQYEYTTHEISLREGDTLYMTSDGFADQFGGPEGKKFRTVNFKKLLLSVQSLSMKEQKETLDKAFCDWKGNLEQLDDVCVIGIRV